MGLTMMMGDTKDALIQVDNGLQKRAGTTIIFESRSPMSGAGVGDDGNTTGNEEGLKRRNMSLIVHERAHSYVSAGKISEQRTATNVREDGKEDLGEWIAEAMEKVGYKTIKSLYAQGFEVKRKFKKPVKPKK